MRPLVLVTTTNINREDWLLARRKGIGGSDIAALVGMSKYNSPMTVYMDKIGEMPATEENEAMYWGNVLEEVVAKEFEKRSGLKVRKKNAIMQHPQYEMALANVDRLVVGKNEGLECKTTSAFLLNEWNEEEVPPAYFLQCQWYMAVTSYQRWHLAVLIGGNTFKFFTIDRDDELINVLLSKAKDFWNDHVLKHEPPIFDGSDASSELLAYMYPESTADEEIELSPDADKWLSELKKIKEQEKEIKKKKTEAENNIKAEMGTAEIGRVNGQTVTWKSVEANRIDTKALKKENADLVERYMVSSQSRRLLIK